MTDVGSEYRWQDDAACRTEPKSMFFPAKAEDAAPALAVCARCPVIDACDRDTEALPAAQRMGVRAGRWLGAPPGITAEQLEERRARMRAAFGANL